MYCNLRWPNVLHALVCVRRGRSCLSSVHPYKLVLFSSMKHHRLLSKKEYFQELVCLHHTILWPSSFFLASSNGNIFYKPIDLELTPSGMLYSNEISHNRKWLSICVADGISGEEHGEELWIWVHEASAFGRGRPEVLRLWTFKRYGRYLSWERLYLFQHDIDISRRKEWVGGTQIIHKTSFS